VKDELRELYQRVIVEHSKQPRNFRTLPGEARIAQGHNPLCGDIVTVYVDMEGDVLRDVAFQGVGCAISTASASLMTEVVKGKSRAETTRLCAAFHALVTEGIDTGRASELGAVAVFAGVRRFLSRIKCAELPWRTLQAALQATVPGSVGVPWRGMR
jgi:nitrogen fixation NifU-like protein